MFRNVLNRMASTTAAAPKAAAPLVLRAFLTHSASATGSFALRTPYITHLTDGPNVTEVSATKEELLQYFRTMTVWRRFAIAADQLYKDRKIRGFLHLADGQEAVYQGIEAGIKKTDSIITAYRCHLPAMARGSATLAQVFAELMGKATGPSGGKGGSMHIAYRGDTRFYGGNGIVGAQVPVGAGVAMAHKYRGDGGVCVAMYGDGASNQGQIYEAANMAQLWKLPCLFVCENNLYGMGTSTQRASGHLEFYKRGLNIPGIQIDGFDVLAVKEGFRWAADYARAGNGPMFIEVRTYRYHGHSMSDPGVSYRSRDEVTEMRQTRDCVLGVRNRLLEAGWATEADFKAIDRDARAEIQNAIQFAESSPYPAPEELYSHIQIGAPPPLIRTVEFEKSIVTA